MDDSHKTSGKKAHLWKPGQSANPGGRPKGSKLLRETARAMTMEAVNALKEALYATKIVGMKQEEVADHPTRIHAAQVILDRGYGKPVLANEMEEDELPAELSDEQLLAMANEVLKKD